MTNRFDWTGHYDTMHSVPPQRYERPVIGITGNFSDGNCTLSEAYYRSILLAGGIPVIIPPYEDTDNLGQLLDRVDGIVFSGGADINPLYLGEEPVPQLHGINAVRDEQELMLAKMAYNRQIPILGICRGIQTLMAALGGEVYQDIYSQMGNVTIRHSQDLSRGKASHTVCIAEDSLLHDIFTEDGEYDFKKFPVNSFHHQAARTPAPGFRVVAESPDGVIEAVESTEYKSVMAVQWHPECFIMEGDKCMMPLFEWLVRESQSFLNAKRLHSQVLSLDSHCDTPMFFSQGVDFGSREKKTLVDIHKMYEGQLDACIMVAYLKQEGLDVESSLRATADADRILTEIEAMAEKVPMLKIARTPDDLYDAKRKGGKSIMLGIENGYAIGSDISNVERLRRRGVVYMTLCHNGDNLICDSAKGQNTHGGVSAFGESVIREMNRVGMMVDLSHASEKSFYDAIDISTQPIICSHSSAYALCAHPRNLTDDQMRRLAETGGVAQVTLYNGFLRTDGQASILDAMDHLCHMIDVMGIDHVGIGTDFDGDGGVPGVASASELINITRRLLARRYSQEDIRKIWGGNLLRLMDQIQKQGI